MSQTIIKARVIDQTLELLNLSLIASGSQDAIQVEATFDSLWDGYNKVAVFYRDESEVYHIPFGGNVATIPHEVLTEEGFFWFGIMGLADNTRTTEALRVTVKRGAITSANAEHETPAPDIYVQLLSSVCDVSEALAVEKARVDQLVAMSSGAHTTDYPIMDDGVQGQIRTNGFSAFISFEFTDLPITAYGYRQYQCIAPDAIPFEQVDLYSTNESLLFTVEPPAEGNTYGTIWVRNNTASTVNTSAECRGYYPLANPRIPELTDLRADAQGRTWGTAGESFRQNTRPALHVGISSYDADGTPVASRDALTIYEQACVEGRAVYLDWGPGIHIPLAYSTQEQARFDDLQVTEDGFYSCQIIIGSDGRARKVDYTSPALDDSRIAAETMWSSKNTVDKLCPAFAESGSVVTCEPVEGYPLTVTTGEDATQITQCGKNLAVYPYKEKTKTQNGITFTDNGDGSVTMNGTATANATFFFANQQKWNVKIGANYAAKLHKISGSYSGGTPSWAVNYNYSTSGDYWSWMEVLVGGTKTAPCPTRMVTMATYLVVKTGTTCTDLVVKPQLEAGTVATAYEPYKAPKTFAPGDTIPAASGLNTLYADNGDITVTGRTDPTAVINKLTNAIIALGGNI